MTAEYKAGNEFLPYHPQASHVSPDYRDGWNACYRAAMEAQAPAEVHGDVWSLIERYAAAKVDCATNPTHESAKAYARLAESDLRDALGTSDVQPKDTAEAEPTSKQYLREQVDKQMAGVRAALAAPSPAPAPETQHDGWNGPYNCIAAGPTATDVALHRAMNEAAKVGNRDDDKLIRKALNDAGYYLVRSMKKPGTCEHLLAVPCAAVGDAS